MEIILWRVTTTAASRYGVINVLSYRLSLSDQFKDNVWPSLVVLYIISPEQMINYFPVCCCVYVVFYSFHMLCEVFVRGIMNEPTNFILQRIEMTRLNNVLLVYGQKKFHIICSYRHQYTNITQRPAGTICADLLNIGAYQVFPAYRIFFFSRTFCLPNPFGRDGIKALFGTA